MFKSLGYPQQNKRNMECPFGGVSASPDSVGVTELIDAASRTTALVPTSVSPAHEELLRVGKLETDSSCSTSSILRDVLCWCTPRMLIAESWLKWITIGRLRLPVAESKEFEECRNWTYSESKSVIVGDGVWSMFNKSFTILTTNNSQSQSTKI